MAICAGIALDLSVSDFWPTVYGIQREKHRLTNWSEYKKGPLISY